MAANQIAVQSYMPTYRRRAKFTPAEQSAIDAGQQQWMPAIFKSQADSPAVDMASPNKMGLTMGALAGTAGALGGAAFGAPTDHAGAGALIGGGAAAILGYLLSRRSQAASNDSITESMRRIPANGTRRDIESDPVYQATLNRMTQLQAAD